MATDEISPVRVSAPTEQHHGAITEWTSRQSGQQVRASGFSPTDPIMFPPCNALRLESLPVRGIDERRIIVLDCRQRADGPDAVDVLARKRNKPANSGR